MTPLPERCLSEITCGLSVYTYYPIREIDRLEAEHTLSLPEHARSIIIRSSPSSRRAHPNVYYVVSYVPDGQMARHVLITEQNHRTARGRLSALIPFPLDEYELIMDNSPAFLHTHKSSIEQQGQPGQPGRS